MITVVLATALVASTAPLPTCSWDRPGANPYVGDVVAAVDHYTDIPVSVRARLKQRMAARDYDEVAAIGRDSIVGEDRYGAEIRDMHFGRGDLCRSVTRTKWRKDAIERGLVYCESDHCIIVPTVCRNVSRIKRLNGEVAGVRATRGRQPGASATMPSGADGPGPGAGPESIIGGKPAPAAMPERAAIAAARTATDAGAAAYATSIVGDLAPLAGEVPARWVDGLPGGSQGGAADGRLGGIGGIGNGIIGTPSMPSTGLPFIGTGASAVTILPEPGTWLLWLLGLATAAARAAWGRRP